MKRGQEVHDRCIITPESQPSTDRNRCAFRLAAAKRLGQAADAHDFRLALLVVLCFWILGLVVAIGRIATNAAAMRNYPRGLHIYFA